MSMILFSGRGARCSGYRVGFGTWATVALVFGGLIPATAFIAGMRLGAATQSAPAAAPIATAPAAQRPALPEAIIEQRVQQRLEQQLGAIAPRLARLQAESTRLDAIANRLIQDHGSDSSDFKLGSGGPESSDARSYTAVEFESALNKLTNDFRSHQETFASLDQLLTKQRLDAEITPSGWPVTGGWVSSPYGRRSDPVNGKRAYHHGIDIAAKRYTPIHSVAAGIVTFSGRRTGYGRVVEVTHGKGYKTVYAHNQQNKVKVGDRVSKGQTIASIGSSGRATGPHIHFEVRRYGKPINPGRFMQAKNRH
jgi:murein DD-endopeptidase MepM/ murein hydrolase activator NlpD